MKHLLIATTIVLLAAGSSFAQTSQTSHIYANFAGGVAVSPDGTSGDALGEVGVRIAPNLYVFGDIGQFHNLQPSQLQPAVTSTDSALSGDGVTITGTARVPAWYGMGGVRWVVPVQTPRLSPYVFGGAGFARLTPTAQFIYNGGGTLPGSTTVPVMGDDVTSQLVSLGDFSQPAASTAFMFAVGGGVEAPIAPHLVADVGYRVSRVAADTRLNALWVRWGGGYIFCADDATVVAGAFPAGARRP